MYCNNPNNTTPANVEAISAVSCTLSILGAIVIFMTYIFIPEIRNTTRKLVTCLTVADLFTPFGYLTSIIYHESKTGANDTLFCTIQSVVTTYSSLVSFFLTVFIALHLFLAVLRPQNSPRGLILPVANIISWGVPGIIISVALAENMLGREANDSTTIGTGSWCWVKCKESDTHKTLFYMYFTGKGFELQCYLYTAALYVLMKLRIHLVHRHRSLHAIQPDLRDDDQNFVYVWLVLLMIRIWGTIRFFLRAIPKSASDVNDEMERVDKVLTYFQAIGDPSQAFCNCILFCLLDGDVRAKILGYISCRTSNTQTNYMDTVEDTENDFTSAVASNGNVDFSPLFGHKSIKDNGRRRYGSCSELLHESVNQHNETYERLYTSTR
ncbi:G-protein coupled receptor 157-like [Mya arenaria]|uniref:G-protein coupled receptor 157-like n=1 Tax=Mya arenaria TaxID=6604 RepID=UPI0022E784B8|nr:G-protein coupled receptor 157-like [Mya arenaria]